MDREEVRKWIGAILIGLSIALAAQSAVISWQREDALRRFAVYDEAIMALNERVRVLESRGEP